MNLTPPDLSSLTPVADIADFTRVLNINFADANSLWARRCATPEQWRAMRDLLNDQRAAVLTRLSSMLGGLLPEGFIVKRPHSASLEVVPPTVPGADTWSDRVTVELGIHDKGCDYFLAFTLRQGGYRGHKFVRKVAVSHNALTTAKLDATLGAVRDEIVRLTAYAVTRFAQRVDGANAAAARRQQAVAALPEALRAQMTDRYGPNTPYIDDIKLTSDGYFVLNERNLTIKPELVAEFVDLLRRNNAK